MEIVVESMEMASRAIPHPGNRDFCPPNLVFDGGGTLDLWRKYRTPAGGFSLGVYVGERARSVAHLGAHTTCSRDSEGCRGRTW